MTMNVMVLRSVRWVGLAVGLLCSVADAARAQSPPVPINVVSLSASATAEVQKDWLTVVFSTNREGSDAAAVQQQLKQALETALAEAKKVARPGQLEVQTGGFSLAPRYGPKGGMNGWQGSTELLVEGHDTQAIAQLTAKLQTLTISRVGFSLSAEVRRKVEAEVTAQAIDRFRSRADAVSRQFGFTSYTVREVAVSSEAPGFVAEPRMRVQSAMVMNEAAAPLPLEAGKAVVSANVSGTVQLK
jgi:predicted secreted protein